MPSRGKWPAQISTDDMTLCSSDTEGDAQQRVRCAAATVLRGAETWFRATPRTSGPLQGLHSLGELGEVSCTVLHLLIGHV